MASKSNDSENDLGNDSGNDLGNGSGHGSGGAGELPEGKVPPRVLNAVLERLARLPGPEAARSGLVLGPATGEDAAVADPGQAERLVMAADPITFPAAEPGRHAVIVNANDVAATGGEPRWFLSSLLAPPGTDEARLRALATEVAGACREVGAVAAGGHTEITPAVSRIVVAGTMIGVAPADRVKPSGGARLGDLLLITKGIAVEATAVVAASRAGEVSRDFGPDFQARCARFAADPGISVVPEARVAAGVPEVHAMHDVTEGGVATALREMADRADLGLVVVETEIPRFYESKRLLRHFGLDLLGAIGSGALLIACAEPGVAGLLEQLEAAGQPGFVIGRFTRRSEGLRLRRGSAARDLPVFERDELARLEEERPAAPEPGEPGARAADS